MMMMTRKLKELEGIERKQKKEEEKKESVDVGSGERRKLGKEEEK